MNKEFLIENLQEFNAYLIDVLHNGLEGQPLTVLEREVYKMAITSVYFLINFLER